MNHELTVNADSDTQPPCLDLELNGEEFRDLVNEALKFLAPFLDSVEKKRAELLSAAKIQVIVIIHLLLGQACLNKPWHHGLLLGLN